MSRELRLPFFSSMGKLFGLENPQNKPNFSLDTLQLLSENHHA
jgi:hypothetical protein